ncbi:MAG TPA: VOC family protein [Candidatus Binataceae bacterium]|nr:VOC family protein [Candidatus Binataceae bacterium]
MSKVSPIPQGFHTVTPYLNVADARKFIEFVKRAFDAAETEFVDMGGGHVHAEVRVGDSMIMVGQGAAAPAFIYLYVEHVDAVHARAVAAGGRAIEAPNDKPYGDRSSTVIDPSGITWWLATRIENVSGRETTRRMAARK